MDACAEPIGVLIRHRLRRGVVDDDGGTAGGGRSRTRRVDEPVEVDGGDGGVDGGRVPILDALGDGGGKAAWVMPASELAMIMDLLSVAPARRMSRPVVARSAGACGPSA